MLLQKDARAMKDEPSLNANAPIRFALVGRSFFDEAHRASLRAERNAGYRIEAPFPRGDVPTKGCELHDRRCAFVFAVVKNIDD
jgi:hypothetical protein